jgi:hypothetical protein
MNPAETSLRRPQFSSHISGLLAEESTSSIAEKLLAIFEINYDDDDSDAESQVSSSEDGIRLEFLRSSRIVAVDPTTSVTVGVGPNVRALPLLVSFN